MASLVVNAKQGMERNGYKVWLSLIEFEEDGVTIIYAPALDLSGYGNSENEAEKSFFIALDEFFRYTHNKGSLKEVLSELGWKIKVSSKNTQFSSPKNSDLVETNLSYKEILDKNNYKVFAKEVEIKYA